MRRVPVRLGARWGAPTQPMPYRPAFSRGQTIASFPFDIEEVVGSSPISSTMTHCRDSLILGSAFFISCDQVDRLLEPQLSSLAVRESVKLDKHF